jgi:uncharacterized membrane protein YeaQ/YmgE (transglycosylase-associated protein family)
MIWFVLTLFAVGIVAGFIARAIVPGPDPVGVGRTVLIGLLGAALGGALGYWLFGADPSQVDVWVAGILGALTVAVLVLLLDNYWTGRKNQLTL